MAEAERPPPEELERAVDGLLGSLARSYGMDKREVLGVIAKKYGGTNLHDTKKAEEELRTAEAYAPPGSPMNRLLELEVVDEMRDRRDLRRREREKRLKGDEEDEDMKKSDSNGFDMDKMMSFMMMKAMMKEMGGGEKNDVIEIMKLKILAGGGDNKGEMDKLIAEMKAQREADRVDRERMLDVFSDKQEKDKWQKFVEEQDKRREERDAMFIEELRAVRTGQAPRDEPNKIVAAAEELESARKSLQTVGAIRPETAEERDFALRRETAKVESEREGRAISFLDGRLKSIESSLDRKLDLVLSAFMNEQRLRANQLGVQLPQVGPPAQGPPPQPAGLSRDTLYERMQGAAAENQSGEPAQQ
jgi:hypothetical protein